MSEVEFRPETWRSSGDAFESEAASVAQAVQSVISANSDMGAMGAGNGGTLADAALATVFPMVFERLTESINSIADGLAADGTSMIDTAAVYEQTEQTNTDTANATNTDIANAGES
ncbi:hypothetical protein [Parenemella sanctibonifatiensis]|uniref:Uncharacterized protein n=1 Tax=Parenemella sanctibonifatiensis TaxID=2016505 RepID=A0A255EIG3_9ACTN|nr:hypothetical protein [Parenemella sanctibonifatiensis]OYN91030.1 hypothetical protein CGZ91_06055 [Parenemella sanctibonifatiensis]